MKDQINSTTAEIVTEIMEPEELYQNNSFERKIESDIYVNTSLGNTKLKSPTERSTKLSEEDIRRKLTLVWENLDSMPKAEQYNWTKDRMSELLGNSLTEPLVQMSSSLFFDGDTGISMDIKPEWLDEDKFKRGQLFGQKHIFGTFYADVLSLFAVYTFKFGLEPVIMTGASSTPYTSFRRYLSAITRFRNWYTSDPWTPGTAAYKDMKAARRLHAMVRKKMDSMSPEEYTNKTHIENAWCPALSTTRKDFQSSCPMASTPEQCFYTVLENHPELIKKNISQADMSFAQFAFIGLIVLKPEFFGMHESDEDIDAFCHVWRGIGYLLGIDDKYNFCRGTLEEVRNRSRDFIQYWLKPNLREIYPEWEHMMRCMVEGMGYYFPGATYESCLIDLATVLDLEMPQLYKSLSYSLWLRYGIIRFYFNYGCRLPGVRSVLTYCLHWAIDSAHNYSDEKNKQLQEKSARLLESYGKQTQKEKLQ